MDTASPAVCGHPVLVTKTVVDLGFRLTRELGPHRAAVTDRGAGAAAAGHRGRRHLGPPAMRGAIIRTVRWLMFAEQLDAPEQLPQQFAPASPGMKTPPA